MSSWINILEDKPHKRDMEKIVARTILYRNTYTKLHKKGKKVENTIQHYRNIVRSGKYIPSILSKTHYIINQFNTDDILQQDNVIQVYDIIDIPLVDVYDSVSPWIKCN